MSDGQVAVTDCSTGIAAVQSQQATVNSQQQKLMTFIVNGDNLFGGNKQCTGSGCVSRSLLKSNAQFSAAA